MLADDSHMQLNVNMAGLIDPSWPRVVDQFIARAEQPLELAHGGTCDMFSEICQHGPNTTFRRNRFVLGAAPPVRPARFEQTTRSQ